MNWGNAIVRKDHQMRFAITLLELELHLAGDVKTTERKITWLSDHQNRVLIQTVDFNFLITKDKLEEEDEVEDFLTPQTETRTDAFADCNIADIQSGDIIQFERKGYYRCDRAAGTGGSPAIFSRFQVRQNKVTEKGKRCSNRLTSIAKHRQECTKGTFLCTNGIILTS